MGATMTVCVAPLPLLLLLESLESLESSELLVVVGGGGVYVEGGPPYDAMHSANKLVFNRKQMIEELRTGNTVTVTRAAPA